MNSKRLRNTVLEDFLFVPGSHCDQPRPSLSFDTLYSYLSWNLIPFNPAIPHKFENEKIISQYVGIIKCGDQGV